MSGLIGKECIVYNYGEESGRGEIVYVCSKSIWVLHESNFILECEVGSIKIINPEKGITLATQNEIIKVAKEALNNYSEEAFMKSIPQVPYWRIYEGARDALLKIAEIENKAGEKNEP